MKFVIGNWKMNGTAKEKLALLKSLKGVKTKNKIIICLPFTLIPGENYGIVIGAQNVSEHQNGAYTGDISGKMLKEIGAKYVIVGHSERRLYHNETNETVQAKASMAIKNGLVPIICIGETLDEKKANKTVSVIKKMLLKSIPSNGKFIVAYEPRGAIGSGITPSEKDITKVHKIIFDTLNKIGCEKTPIIYGGSVNAKNAHDITTIPHVDGVLVGGASLKSETFLPIIDSIN